MFLKSVITDEVSQDLSVAIDFAVRHKLDAIELRSVEEKNPFEFDKNDIVKIKQTVEKSNLSVCCISAPFYKCDLDNNAEIAEHIEGLKRCIEMSHKFGCKLIRGFTFWNKGDFNLRFDDIVAQLLKPIELLKQADIKLVLEFDPSVYATNASKTARVLKAVNSPYIRGLWDPGNDIYDDEHETPYPDGYYIIKPYIEHIHLKDASLINGKAEAMPIGKGDVDFAGQFKALISDGYGGYVSLETHYRPAHELSEDILKQPKGSSFSYLGLEASEECMENWNELMKGLY